MQISSWIRSLIGCTLLGLLSVPTFVPALHEILHLHQHHYCHVVPGDTHLHAVGINCTLCDYFTTFIEAPGAVPIIFISQPAFSLPAIRTQDWPVVHLVGSQYLRGPPAPVC